MINYYCNPIVCIVGILGNVLALLILLQRKMRATTTSLYMAVTACSDILILTSYFLKMIVSTWFNYAISRIFCIIILPVFYSIHYSAALLVAMTVEKYISVKYPLKASIWITRRKAIFVITGLGVILFALNIHHVIYVQPVLQFNSTEKHCFYFDDNRHFWFLTTVYKWIDSSIYCFIPITSLSILNGLIIRLLLKAKNESAAMAKVDVLVTAKRKNTVEKQITIMLLATTSMFCVLTMPIAVSLIVSSINPILISNLTWAVLICLELINHSLNVMIYSCGSEQFRKQLIILFCKSSRERKDRSTIRYGAHQEQTPPATCNDVITE